MTWFRVDDSLAHHAKVLAAGNAAMGLWVRAGAWSAQQLTDGHIPRHVAMTIGKRSQANALVECGLWTEDEDGYCFHEWSHCNPSAEEVRKQRADKHEAKARAGRAGGIASGVARRKHNPSTEEAAGEADAKQNGSSVQAQGEANGKQNEAPTRPDPTRTQEPTSPAAAPRQLGLVPDVEPDPFAEWWDAYPRHEDRKKAQLAYAKAVRRLSVDGLLEGARRYSRQVAGKDKKFVLLPTTWLNGDRWTDEPATTSRFGIGFGEEDRDGPPQVMSGAEWSTPSPRSTA